MMRRNNRKLIYGGIWISQEIEVATITAEKNEDLKIEAIVKIEVKTLLLSLLKKDIYFLLS